MFAYIAGGTFVLQEIYGLSAQGFSFVFGVNSLAIMAMSQLGGALARSWASERVLALGLLVNLAGASALVVTVLTGLPLPFLVGSLLVMVSAVGLVFPTSTALALADYPDRAGTASSLLGLGQYIAGAVAAPLVGIAGSRSAVPLGVVAVVASAGASVVFATLMLPVIRSRRTNSSGDRLPAPLLADAGDDHPGEQDE
jgi:DHA1 family bicyclomycin/chloramphenicol resistance-like MFS transporter